MKLAYVGIVVGFLYVVSPVFAVEPDYREITFGASYASPSPRGEWGDVMGSGHGFAAELGMAVSRRVVFGLGFEYGILDNKLEFVPPKGAPVKNNDWQKYFGALYGEYLVSNGPWTPFLGAGLGGQAIHINFDRLTEGVDGQGYFDFAYGVWAGFQYRNGRSWGAILKVKFEEAPGLESGGFASLQLGGRVFL